MNQVPKPRRTEFEYVEREIDGCVVVQQPPWRDVQKRLCYGQFSRGRRAMEEDKFHPGRILISGRRGKTGIGLIPAVHLISGRMAAG